VLPNSSYSAMIGGRSNSLSGSYSAIIGGWANTAAGSYASIMGGFSNSVAGSYSAIMGGRQNTAAGSYSFIGSGFSNAASTNYAAAISGYGNTASGLYAVVPGGRDNVAAGPYSFAAGFRAKATNPGSFVWADSQNSDFASTASNQFIVRARGGVGINTNNPGTNALLVNGNVQINGTLQASSLAPGSVTPQAMATGAVSSWQVIAGTSSITAQPNTKYLMPESGSGVLAAPTTPSAGQTIVAAGQGRIEVTAGQMISGLWFSPPLSLRPDALFVSDNGNIVTVYSSPTPYMGGPSPMPTGETGKFTILRIDNSSQTEVAAPPASANVPPMPNTLVPLAVSGTGDKIMGAFGMPGAMDMGGDLGLYLWQATNSQWQQIAPTNELAQLERIEALAASSDFRRIYVLGRLNWEAGSGDRLLRSTNSGTSWQTIVSPRDTNSWIAPGSTTLKASSDGSTLYLSEWAPAPTAGAQVGTLWKSTNRGTSWTQLNLPQDVEAASPAFTISGDGSKIALASRQLQEQLPPAMPTLVSTLSVSDDGGQTWRTLPDIAPSAGPYAGGATPQSSGEYLLTRSGNLLIYRWISGYGGPSMPTYVSLSTSSNMGETWSAGQYGFGMVIANPANGSSALATDANGTQIALARWDYNYGDPAQTQSAGGVYLSAARSISLSDVNSAAELVFRGNGRWSLINPVQASGYFQPAATSN
jgi:hypothetical protein